MTNETLIFRRVFIRSESDLPKEEGRYWVHVKFTGILDLDVYHFLKDDNVWMDNVDWYLCPIAEPSDAVNRYNKLVRKAQYDNATNNMLIGGNIKQPSEAESKLDLIYSEFGEWTKKTFPDAHSVEHLIKLKEEADEAIAKPSDITEYADCLGAIFGAAYKSGFSFDDLKTAFIKKFEINKSRKWLKSKNGTYQHISNEAVQPQPDKEQKTSEEIIDYLSGNTEPFTLPTIIYTDETEDENTPNKHQYFRDDIVWKAMEEYAENRCDAVYNLLARPAEKLKPLEELYRKEHPEPNGEFYRPDATMFYTWIAKKFQEMYRSQGIQTITEKDIKEKALDVSLKMRNEHVSVMSVFKAGAEWAINKLKP